MSEKSRREILKRNKNRSHTNKDSSSNQKKDNDDSNLYKSSSEVSNAYDKIEKKFEKFINSKTSKYFIKGGDNEDIKQEGRIGLHKAIRDFDDKRGMSFVGFACMCIERHLVSTIKRGLRNKVEILNESQSLDQKVYMGNDGEDETTLLDLLCDESTVNPEDSVVAKDQYNTIKSRLFDKLTAMERCVTNQYLRGYSYKTIAANLNLNAKSVDNAISRVKNKAEYISLDDIRDD